MTLPNAKSKEYKAWHSMIQRVTNTDYKYNDRYSKLGVQENWMISFSDFYKYLGDCPDDGNKWSLGRIENSIGYFEGNIRWETDEQQNRNRFMTVANTSGKTGVCIRRNRDKGMRAVARWYNEEGKSCSKSFSESVYGNCYFEMACKHRDTMIQNLNRMGLDYAHNHGDVFDTQKLLNNLEIKN